MLENDPDGGAVSPGDYVLIEITDTGHGMAPEVLAKAFEPFYSTKDVGKGTGLGLSTVYGIVKQTDGFLFCHTSVGEGTTFRIFLPRHVPSAAAVRTPSEAAEPPVLQPSSVPAVATDVTGSGRILLVEDEEAVRSFAARSLAMLGYTVLPAANGEDGLQMLQSERDEIDLVVSDVVMPEMDGPTLLRHIREIRPDLRVIFMSGYAEEAFDRNLSADEDFVFLQKPFTLKQLATVVKQTLTKPNTP